MPCTLTNECEEGRIQKQSPSLAPKKSTFPPQVVFTAVSVVYKFNQNFTTQVCNSPYWCRHRRPFYVSKLLWAKIKYSKFETLSHLPCTENLIRSYLFRPSHSPRRPTRQLVEEKWKQQWTGKEKREKRKEVKILRRRLVIPSPSHRKFPQKNWKSFHYVQPSRICKIESCNFVPLNNLSTYRYTCAESA